jgi:hypothetical protein
MRLFVADSKQAEDYRNINFVEQAPVKVLKLGSYNLPEVSQDFAVKGAAEILARSILIPCLGVLDRNNGGKEKITERLPGDAPELTTCLLISGMLEYDRF